MRNYSPNIIIASIILLIVGCQTHDSNSYYDEQKYIKIKIDKDLEIYHYSADTNRTMIKTFWLNGKLQSKTFFYKGKRDGKWIQYYDDGSISDESFFVNDLPDSLHKSFYRDGKLFKLEKYKLGKRIGLPEYYDTSGVKIIKFDN